MPFNWWIDKWTTVHTYNEYCSVIKKKNYWYTEQYEYTSEALFYVKEPKLKDACCMLLFWTSNDILKMTKLSKQCFWGTRNGNKRLVTKYHNKGDLGVNEASILIVLVTQMCTFIQTNEIVHFDRF